jgi:hypothetical protein
MLRIVLGLTIALSAAVAPAQEWASKMFAERSHDFGAVPRDAKVEYAFTLKNLYAGDVHISHVGVSCGCIQPRIVKDTLKSHEQGTVIAALNTHAFSGQRNVRMTVTIDKPKYAQVELQVRGYIRTDLVLQPGLANLGPVAEGQTSEKTIRLEHYGVNNWKIKEISTDSPYLTASLEEKSRRGGRVIYDLAVRLKEGAPVGYFKDQLFVTTNDRTSNEFPVDVEALIEARLSVSPSTLMLGSLQPGQKVTKRVVVKGAQPFKITEVRCDDDGFTFGSTEEAKTVHLLPVTFEARSPGKIAKEIEIVTDLDNGRSVKLSVAGTVVVPLAGK